MPNRQPPTVQVGLPVRVYESGPGLRQEGAAIGLWANAWRALEALGAADALRPGHLQLSRVELCSAEGRLLRAFGFLECELGPAGAEFRGVRRAQLLQARGVRAHALYDCLPDPERIVRFGAAVTEVLADGASGGGSGDGGGVAVRLSDGSTVSGSALIGADGANSAVARHLGLPQPRYAGYVALRGVAEFPQRPAPPGGLPRDTIRQIWGAGVRAGLYPVTHDSAYWYVCFNAGQEEAAAPPGSPEERQRAALAAVRGWGWEVEEAIRLTPPEDISWSRITDRWTAGSFGRGLVSLAGDAAHPMTPNLGQGGCVALEDAVVAGRALREAADAAGGGRPSAASLASCLRAYEAARSRRCLPLTVRSNLMGAALQLPQPPVLALRNAFVAAAFSPSHFLDHTAFDCGEL
ncbi:hypothetical protein GPECTOR_6g499 [Gonium pectorale]|uniref:FAD-binding domain-containing protein n=1 Tax=Gonium pectorale TaxID=33097 RepID=A0A150GV57_GONPE|nr:hypothetical protein GPECTOR_6g499 [Gonium pectorale]|eukprot:KXZ53582.1 hypothetical protein GPECTOR_6g499 [Gonium pectorale]